MISSEGIRYSMRNIWSRKVRSFLTILSIFLGIATIFIFVSFGLGLYAYVNSFIEGGSADKILVQAKGSMGVPGLDGAFALTDSDVRATKRAGGVYEASGVYMKIALAKANNEKRYVYLSGYDPKITLIVELIDVDIYTGRGLRPGDMKEVVLGYNYMLDNKIFSKGLRINDEIVVQDMEMKVVGFYESTGNPQDDSNIYVSEDAVSELYPNDTDSYGWIIGRVDSDNIDWVVENVERELRSSRDVERGEEDFSVQSFVDMIESYTGTMDIIIGFVILIALISIIVSAINTANTMITSVIERTREIGVIKSIGGKNSEVFGIFLFESAFLGFVAGTIGVFLGWSISYFAGRILDGLGWGFLEPVFPSYLFGSLILFAVLTGAVSGVIPAWNASRTNIVRALRYE